MQGTHLSKMIWIRFFVGKRSLFVVWGGGILVFSIGELINPDYYVYNAYIHVFIYYIYTLTCSERIEDPKSIESFPLLGGFGGITCSYTSCLNDCKVVGDYNMLWNSCATGHFIEVGALNTQHWNMCGEKVNLHKIPKNQDQHLQGKNIDLQKRGTSPRTKKKNMKHENHENHCSQRAPAFVFVHVSWRFAGLWGVQNPYWESFNKCCWHRGMVHQPWTMLFGPCRLMPGRQFQTTSLGSRWWFLLWFRLKSWLLFSTKLWMFFSWWNRRSGINGNSLDVNISVPWSVWEVTIPFWPIGWRLPDQTAEQWKFTDSQGGQLSMNILCIE